MTTERLEERMGRIEAVLPHLATKGDIAEVQAVLPHLATKEDIAEVKRLISDREAIMLKWLIGITTATAVSLVMIFLRRLHLETCPRWRPSTSLGRPRYAQDERIVLVFRKLNRSS